MSPLLMIVVLLELEARMPANPPYTLPELTMVIGLLAP